MKKIFIVSIILVLLISLTACGGNKHPDTVGYRIYDDFVEIVKEDSSITTEALAEKLAANENVPMECGFMAVEPGYLNGFDEEVDGFKSGAVFSPYIGTIPYVGYVFEVEGDIDAFVEQLKSKANLNWNICTQADEIVCETYKDRVFFVMAPLSFDDEGSSDSNNNDSE